MAQDLAAVAKQIRMDIIEETAAAGSRHPGGSLSSTEILTVLYFDKMNIDPANPHWPDRDRFQRWDSDGSAQENATVWARRPLQTQ